MKKRIAVIHKDKCNPQGCGNYLCAKLCPVNRTGEDCIKEGDEYSNKAVIDEILCTGCGICPTRCPYGAIEIINLPAELEKEPVHRFDKNSFALYSLPTPVNGKITGLLGRNGMGKSTAFKILGGLQMANLGNYEEKADVRKLFEYFKGTQMLAHLERLEKGEVTLSYKPQQVEFIPRQFDGTVKELFKSESAKKMLKQLDIEHTWDRDVKHISGGELQRVAIAAAALKKATLTLYDEPSSYLDIKQRINVSKFIREHSSENTATMIIEHDLIILDYMTDVLNIMYGHPGVYGIVSGVKSVREGINSYLDGYLKEENTRIRTAPLKFEQSVERVTAFPQPVLEWSELQFAVGEFNLSVHKGALNKNEIIGILGENGIGKTTFVKMLAGEVESDLDQQLNVAYKPQYLDYANNETLVAEFLSRAIEHYEASIVKPLNLETLYGRQLNQLSGGELQRVVIAKTLAENADLFLLDEPSAYLDVEQRIAIGKVIKRVAADRELTIMVVDHDLMFMDFLSDKIMVFEGTPGQHGEATGPWKKQDGMNKFLENLNITLRRDMHSHRPRINKQNSVKDRDQRSANKWYY